MKALKAHTLADHGAFDAAAQPTKFPAGLFHICTGSYDFKHAFVDVDAVHTNKAPGGIAYRCSFRVTEASYLIERMMDTLAHDLGKDPAQLRLQNFIKPAAQREGLGLIGWHTFRRTFSTLLRGNGEDIKVQQELMRHTDIRTTMNLYTQANSDQKRQAHGKIVQMVLAGPPADCSPVLPRS